MIFARGRRGKTRKSFFLCPRIGTNQHKWFVIFFKESFIYSRSFAFIRRQNNLFFFRAFPRLLRAKTSLTKRLL